MKKMILPLTLLLILLFSACGASQPAPDDDAAESQTAASFASFTAVDLEGNQVDESIFAGYDLTMINIWATFCGPCLDEMPDLGSLAAQYADEGVRVVGIVSDVPLKADGSYDSDMVITARELAELTGADYLHLLPSADLAAAKLSGMRGVPETIFVDSAGNLVGESYLGSRSRDEWAAIIDNTLLLVQAD